VSPGLSSGGLDINDPLFNLREIVKQLLLLEEHLLVPAKRCPKCIKKHLLTIEALCDEARCLDEKGRWCGLIEQLRVYPQQWDDLLSQKSSPSKIGQRVRAVRRQLLPMLARNDGGRARRNSAHLITDTTEVNLQGPTGLGPWPWVIAAAGIGLWVLGTREARERKKRRWI
jgi:hypothetical protein